MAVTFRRQIDGDFEVLQDGQLTKYYLFNTSKGISDINLHYWAIEDQETQELTYPGSLIAAKQLVTKWLTN